MADAFKIVSLYSGCGGMDLGFHKEGFELVWANDIDEHACRTYRNFFGSHIVEGSIADADLSKIPDCDLVLGGFPCQDFSMIWKRGGVNTDRGNLYRYLVEVVNLKNPLMFVAENVKGLLSANNGNAIKQIVEDFKNTGKHGYDVSWHLVNFADYGTPQLRQRVLIIGTRKDLNSNFEVPEPTHETHNHVSSRTALKGAALVQHNNERQNLHLKTIELLKLIPPGGNFTSIPKDSPYYVKGMISHVYRRLHPDKPSKTIIAGGGGGTWGYHYEEPRSLTNRERARLFGYPDDFVFKGTITQVRKQIGNSVPPVGIRPFAKKIKSYLTENKKCTQIKLNLGESLSVG